MGWALHVRLRGLDLSGARKHDRARGDDNFVFRTPLLPLTELIEWASGDPRRYLMRIVELPEVREALFVASPSLYDAIESWRAAPSSPTGQRVEHSLAKYVARMMGRATPFGLFSGVSVGTLGRETKLLLSRRDEYRRRTRLDNDYLFTLSAALVAHPEARRKLTFRPNTSLYRTANRLRYARARVVGADRSYHLVSLEPSHHLDTALARSCDGATFDVLAAAIIGDDCSPEQAIVYIDSLIDAQVIVPDLGVHITGPEPLEGMLAQLRRARLDEARGVLDDVRARIGALDECGVGGNTPDRYRSIAGVLESLPASFEHARLFQVDMIKPASATLSARVVGEVSNALNRLGQIRAKRESLDDFKRAFRGRYEERAIPLAEALDEESGIGFETLQVAGAEGSPLLAGIPIPGPPGENRQAWSPAHEHLLRRLAEALAIDAHEIELGDADLDAMKLPTPAVLGDAYCAMIRVAATPDELARGEIRIFLEGAGGPSGAKYFGRFCHVSPEIDAIVQAHHQRERALRPEAVFAEIVHLNEGRIGNIVCRPVMRSHEIVYLGISGAPERDRIGIDDLLVSVRGDRVVLTSKRLGREVLPRLTTAHNFRLRSLGVYRFLCALANQDVDSVVFSWGTLGKAPFLPRVRIGRVVVSRATWNLGAGDLGPITTAVRAASKRKPSTEVSTVASAIAALRSTRRLPRFFVLSSGDNELPVDLDNPLLVAAFADELCGSDHAVLEEMFPQPGELVVTGPEGAFASEIVLTYTRQREPDRARPTVTVPTIKRAFLPGSDWLFAKIYCGEATSDRVLCEAVAPVVRAAMARGDANRWFFIRYHDPDPHVRVRLQGDPDRLRGGVLRDLERAVVPLAECGAVHKLVLDTYVRELERYGSDRGIELVEELFWRDSEAVLGIVELLDGEDGAAARWKLCVRGVDSMLDAIGLDPSVRERICNDAREMLGRELHATTYSWSAIGDKYAAERADLETMISRDPQRDATHDYQPGFELLARRDSAVAEIGAELRRRDDAGELRPRLVDFAWSLVHMHCNRMLHASHRAQELVIYDFVRRLHGARRNRR